MNTTEYDGRAELLAELLRERYTPRPRQESPVGNNLTARNVHIGDQVLAALRAEADQRLSTVEVARRVGLTGYPGQADVWRALDRLARRGQVERLRLPESRCVYWRVPRAGA